MDNNLKNKIDMKTLFDEMEHAVKNWWLSLILGILYIIVALCLLFAPGSSYIALSVIFSISMLISGIIEIIFSISNRRGISSWGWYLAYHRSDLRHLPGSLSAAQHGSHTVHSRLLDDVPRFLRHRLFYGPEALWHP